MTERDPPGFFDLVLLARRNAFQRRLKDALIDTERLRDGYIRQATALARTAALRHECGDPSALTLRQRAAEFGGRIVALEELLYEFRNVHLVNQEGPTPLAAVRRATIVGTVLRLHQDRKLDDTHARAATDIGIIYEAIAAPLMSRARRLDGVMGGAGYNPYESISHWILDRHKNCYLKWHKRVCRSKRGRSKFNLIMDVVVFGSTLDEARREHHFSYKTALNVLKAGLEMYADLAQPFWDRQRDERQVGELV